MEASHVDGNDDDDGDVDEDDEDDDDACGGLVVGA